MGLCSVFRDNNCSPRRSTYFVFRVMARLISISRSDNPIEIMRGCGSQSATDLDRFRGTGKWG